MLVLLFAVVLLLFAVVVLLFFVVLLLFVVVVVMMIVATFKRNPNVAEEYCTAKLIGRRGGPTCRAAASNL